jgi:hypothetical protein
MRTTLILLVSILLSLNTTAQDKKDPLDGKQFAVDITEKGRIGKDDKMKGVIAFKDGKVSSEFSRNNKFNDAEYTIETKDGMMGVTIVFKGTCKNKKDKLIWEGYVNDDEIEGEAVTRRKGTIRNIYIFEGKLK